jgi:hypothetical protein
VLYGSKSRSANYGDAVRQHVGTIWMNARALSTMDEPARAEWISSRTAPQRMSGEQPESVAAAIAKLDRPEQFGQQLSELRTRMLSARGGVEKVEAIKKEIADLASEHLPPDQRGKLLNLVAGAKRCAIWFRGTQRISNVLAQHDVRRALSDMEDLVGKNQLKVYKPMSTAQRQGKVSARVPGNVDPNSIRQVDLTKLSPEARDEIKPLMEQARLLKKMLGNAGAMGTKPIEQQTRVDALTRATEKFRDIEQQIRVAAANDLASREIEIAGKVQKLADVKEKTLASIKAPPETATPTGEPPKERFPLRSGWRAQENPDALLSRLVGEQHPAWQASIKDIRQGQSDTYQEQRNFEDVLSAKLKDAGIASHTAAYDRWLQNRETLTLPNAGKVKMTRPRCWICTGIWRFPDQAGDPRRREVELRAQPEHRRRSNSLKMTSKPVVSNLKPKRRRSSMPSRTTSRRT